MTKQIALTLASLLLAAGCASSQMDPETAERLRELRNLGKAFYESPGSSEQAVETLREALELVPGSHRERLNYGLALLRAGHIEEGIAELAEVQREDPSIPHTWFNLGVECKKGGRTEEAAGQFEKMAELTPDEAKVHYNLGQLYKLLDREDEAREKFELAAQLDPSMAAPHFQLYNLLRRADREAARVHLDEFQRIKRLQDETGLDEDVDWSFYSELYDPIEPGPAPQVAGKMTFEAVNLGGLEGGIGVAVLDANHDGQPDLVAWSNSGATLFSNESGTLAEAQRIPAEALRHAAAGDSSDDGFPDLCLAGESGGAIVPNNEGTFGEPALLAPGAVSACYWIDYDHDGDLDLIFAGETNTLWRNSGEPSVPLQRRFEQVEFPFERGKRGLAVASAELFEDDNIHLIVAYEDQVVVYLDRKLGRYDRGYAVEGVTPGPAPLRLWVEDLDNDGYLDAALTAADGETRVLRNRAGRLEAGGTIARTLAWADLQNRGMADAVTPTAAALNQGRFVFTETGTEGLPANGVAAAAADFDGDGKIDVAVLGSAGQLSLARNTAPVSNAWTTVRLTGVKSRKIAEGARVEVRSGPVYRKQVYPGYPVSFGLGARETIDTVRITWPNGLIQNEPRQPVNERLEIEEKPRLSGSCPMIFTWNGEEFEFISEVLGVAPLGASLGDGKFFPVDHDEYVLLSGEQLVPNEGFYDVRITEELREVAYVDQVRLFAVDRPAGLEIYTNEKSKAPPFPEFQLFGVSKERKIRPSSARDHRGRDVRSQLLARDGKYVDGFERTYRNTAETHWVELDLAGLSGGEGSMLFLTGWVDWADASTIVAGSQTTSRAIAPPVLQVRDRQGQWRTVIDDLGLPGGSPRTMAVDLSGKFLSDSREVRILTNMCVYWDEIFAADGVSAPPARLSEAPLSAAGLRFRGFSRNVVHPERKQPERFVYADVSPVSNWNPTPGRYTRFGDVRDLLESIDDRMVVMGAGDELVLRFKASLPDPPAGWERAYLLFVDGWAKEQESNTAFGSSVEPLPFHQMSAYPYPSGESFPATKAHREYLETYNVRRDLKLIRPLARK